MIRYPLLKEGDTIGVTAPSSGVDSNLHDLMKQAINRMEQSGFNVVCGETVWTQHKSKSAPALIRAAELNNMIADDNINLIFPPWGGEFLIEVLEHIDFDAIKEKWILGYSDLSTLLLAVTLKTGVATAHGTNLFDLRGEYSDETTAMWKPVLSTGSGQSIVQHSSQNYQKEWNFESVSPYVFHFNEPTSWKIFSDSDKKVTVSGRLLGGCIDTIGHLIGTPYGDVRTFQKHTIQNEPILWYLENSDAKTTDLRRFLVQMKLAGWFDNCSGLLFARTSANYPVDGYTIDDVYQELAEELKVPIVFDIDCGHLPPQMTFINGAYAEVEAQDGKGTVTQYFRP
ncbi:LD-carboxypeptidase [Paenibacillus sp. GSMTC-2017]|uniref:S66 family peptidase n=1 Tax=Paenibacillus sp. GSMTC-2017 TaxID=2794350 RepID=UPI0018D5B163|nr:S66 peptidase family protein [Paenibacillus sp. GSMTC-2017]MBH5319924.1 LD-carboxypeptidase [Paenibacillus sp. GSMTC-2017]